jgi:hypothetical protein
MTRHAGFFLVKRIDNGAVIVGLSLRSYWPHADGIQRDNNDIDGGPGEVESFTI